MNIVLIQARLTQQELDQLVREFPQYLFLSYTETSYKALSPEQWNKVEIIFGNKLTSEELSLCSHLRWIHTAGSETHQLCLHEIEQRGTILVTTTAEENTAQIGEFMIAGLLAFAKNLFHWKEAGNSSKNVWDSKWRDSMWTLEGRTFLQIGLGAAGSHIATLAKQLRMRVIGFNETGSFHPACQKIYSIADVDAFLPKADVVSVALPRSRPIPHFFNRRRLELLKEDSILLLTGPAQMIEESAFCEIASTNKLRGVLFDVNYPTPIPLSSPLWKVPNLVITPDVSPRPKGKQKLAVSTFRYNMRQYIHGNYKDMRNPVDLAG